MGTKNETTMAERVERIRLSALAIASECQDLGGKFDDLEDFVSSIDVDARRIVAELDALDHAVNG